MARHAPRPHALRNTRGFTLLELLVVLLVIGITLTLAMLSIGLSDARGDHEAQRLRAVLELASEQALLQGVELGIEFSAEGYGVLANFDGAWLPLDDDPAWRPRLLPDEIRLRLSVDGSTVRLPESARGAPQLLLYSSGETTPFEIELSAPSGDCLITGDGFSTPAAATCGKAG